jgi:hypothetical protein
LDANADNSVDDGDEDANPGEADDIDLDAGADGDTDDGVGLESWPYRLL